MKKKIFKLLCWIALLVIIIAALNIQVSTKQGINFKVQTIRLPLYLKALDFFDRHYNYKQLVKGIIKEGDNEEKRIMKLFNWTHQNIRKQPEGLPIVDDHVWHIIVRGYGSFDQSSDVFTTLCNYAGVEAFFDYVGTVGEESRIPLAFVKLDNRWRLFDPYNAVYFKNKEGQIADIEEIRDGNWQVENLSKIKVPAAYYKEYLDNLQGVKAIGLRRANIQSPLKRLIFEIRKIFYEKKKNNG